MAKPVHSMIRVVDEERSLAFYREALGLELAQRVDLDGFSLLYLRGPESAFELELTVNASAPPVYDLGDGYGHFAVTVGDLDAEHARLDAAGLAPDPLRALERPGFAARYFFLTDPDGYRIEVIERGGRFA